jgi:CheY-like chemotaxis protein
MSDAMIHEALNGEEAVEKAIGNRPDIILMDMQMEKLDGLEATKIIREKLKDKDVVIIALTAGDIETDMKRCIESGMNDFITKPVTEADLDKIINKWCVGANDLKAVQHFGIEHLHASSGNDEAFEREILQLAIRSIEDSIVKFKHQAGGKDLRGVQATGHKLKGTTSAVGFSVMNQLAEHMENLGELEEKATAKLGTDLEDELIILKKMINDTVNKTF